MTSIVSQDDLNEEFSLFGFEITNEDALARFQELCILHRLSAGDMVTEWVAFTQTKKNNSLEPEMIEHFERERLAKRNQKTPKVVKKESTPKVYTIDSLPMDVEAAEELYSAYGGNTPTTKPIVNNKRQHTPDNGPLKRFTGANRSPVAPYSPASFSPIGATPAKKYNSRINRGDTVASLGSTKNVQWKGSAQTVHIEPYSPDQTLEKPFKYMFQKLIEKFRVLDNVIEDMAEKLQKIHTLDDLAHVGLPTQEDVTVVGRVCCDSQGKLNAKSVVLEGSVDVSAGKTIPLDLSHLKEYSMFPGQIVAMEGNNSTGQKFGAKKLIENTCMPLPDLKSGSEGGQRLSVLIAAGPFSTSDSLSYEPLVDLVQNITKSQPDVCILMGPFVDCMNAEIENGNLKQTYEDLFKMQITSLAESTKNLGCKVLILPSHRDLHHDCVYPQPPFQMDTLVSKYQHIQFLPDPCTISINNVVFGLTSTDILFHLGGEEISSPPGSGDRLGRLTQHLLLQHCYYPFYPPHQDVCIDYEQFQLYAGMPVTPHVLVVPSEFKQFIKDIKGCCCVNPGRLTKGLTGGTYAQLLVQANNMKPQQSLVPNITAQVVRI